MTPVIKKNPIIINNQTTSSWYQYWHVCQMIVGWEWQLHGRIMQDRLYSQVFAEDALYHRRLSRSSGCLGARIHFKKSFLGRFCGPFKWSCRSCMEVSVFARRGEAGRGSRLQTSPVCAECQETSNDRQPPSWPRHLTSSCYQVSAGWWGIRSVCLPARAAQAFLWQYDRTPVQTI